LSYQPFSAQSKLIDNLTIEDPSLVIFFKSFLKFFGCQFDQMGQFRPTGQRKLSVGDIVYGLRNNTLGDTQDP
jgi:hypothetical protein